MSGDHYLPLFVGDFLASTATWSGPERGLYLNMLAIQWSAGPLPADLPKLAIILGYGQREFERLWPTIKPKFQNGDGRLTNSRLEAIRAKNAEIQASKSAKAKTAADARWHASSNAPGNASSNADASLEHMLHDAIRNRSDPNPIRTASEPEKTQEPPCGLDLVSWKRWTEYRTQIRKPLKPVSIPDAQRKLAGYGAEQAAVVGESIANGWTGLFPLKRAASAQVRRDPLTIEEADESDRRAAERARIANGH